MLRMLNLDHTQPAERVLFTFCPSRHYLVQSLEYGHATT
ncbi:uncharacterized protein G2W53_034713 [Senna tora]|uniref:Uncharacterized protein n=1 Tax=Senna tora TaxID=362788 RepID=A0A834T4P5_9FABA|nr:uncharacterized protein G2W53_034713 [Senna tora]